MTGLGEVQQSLFWVCTHVIDSGFNLGMEKYADGAQTWQSGVLTLILEI